MKAAIILVSYGMADRNIWLRTTGLIEESVRKRNPGWDIFEAFTSERMIRKWQEQGSEKMRVEEAFQKMEEDGYEQIIVQPLHLVNGIEYQKIEQCALKCREKGISTKVGRPLLEDSFSRKKTVDVLAKELSTEKGEMILLVGHGTQTGGNAAYEKLSKELASAVEKEVIWRTLLDKETFDDFSELQGCKTKNIRIIPILYSTGKKAMGEIAGPCKESIKVKLENMGYKVRVEERGLADHEGIREAYVDALDKTICL